MANEEQRVRDAAKALNDAIVDAREAGLRVDWPLQSDGLVKIAISAGRKAMTPEEIGKAAQAQAEREQQAQKPEPEKAPPLPVNRIASAPDKPAA